MEEFIFGSTLDTVDYGVVCVCVCVCVCVHVCVCMCVCVHVCVHVCVCVCVLCVVGHVELSVPMRVSCNIGDGHPHW